MGSSDSAEGHRVKLGGRRLSPPAGKWATQSGQHLEEMPPAGAREGAGEAGSDRAGAGREPYWLDRARNSKSSFTQVPGKNPGFISRRLKSRGASRWGRRKRRPQSGLSGWGRFRTRRDYCWCAATSEPPPRDEPLPRNPRIRPSPHFVSISPYVRPGVAGVAPEEGAGIAQGVKRAYA